MASAKYTAAPTQDPDEHGDAFPQAPPEYQAESSSAQDAQGIFGGPRDSEDNVPDDFKVSLYSPILRYG